MLKVLEEMQFLKTTHMCMCSKHTHTQAVDIHLQYCANTAEILPEKIIYPCVQYQIKFSLSKEV